MKVHIFHTGKVYIDKALAYKEKSFHPMPYTGWLRGKKTKSWVPVSSYLIEHPKGLILVDTGWHEEIRYNQKKHLGRFAYSMYKGQLPPAESINEKLASLGLKSRDIDYVFLTHLHSDHASGLKHVKDAKKILVSDIEWQAAARKIGYIRSMWEYVPIQTFPFEAIPYGPFQRGLDVFGDSSLYLIHTPGHTDGMFSVLIRMNQGWLLLASDVGYSSKSWEQMILPGVTTNVHNARKSLKWVRDFSKREDCLQVLANHDPAIDPQVIV